MMLFAKLCPDKYILLPGITHTLKDNLEVVNDERVAECVQGIAAFLQKLEE